MASKVYYPLLEVEEVIHILNKIAIFGALTEQQLYEIFKLLKTTEYGEGEYVYRIGDAPSHIYIIEKGEIRIVLDAAHVSLELISLEVGDCFGETSVIGIQPHSSSAVAVKPTKLIVLERQALLNIYETDKELFGMLVMNIARETARRLTKAEVEMSHLLLKK